MASQIALVDLLKFLATAGEKGWIKPQTAEPMRQCCERVLKTLEADQQLDLANVDVDQTIRQFANLNAGISPTTLTTYASRIRSAIRMFADAKANPTTWKMPAGRSSGVAKTNGKPAADVKAGAPVQPVRHTVKIIEAGPSEVSSGFSRGLSYPFPLRNDVIVTIADVPRDMTKSEAARLSAFLAALAVGGDQPPH